MKSDWKFSFLEILFCFVGQKKFNEKLFYWKKFRTLFNKKNWKFCFLKFLFYEKHFRSLVNKENKNNIRQEVRLPGKVAEKSGRSRLATWPRLEWTTTILRPPQFRLKIRLYKKKKKPFELGQQPRSLWAQPAASYQDWSSHKH